MWKRKKSFLILYSFISQVKKNIACQKYRTYINLAAEHLQKPSKSRFNRHYPALHTLAYVLSIFLSSSISCLFCSHLLSTYDRNYHISITGSLLFLLFYDQGNGIFQEFQLSHSSRFQSFLLPLPKIVSWHKAQTQISSLE